ENGQHQKLLLSQKFDGLYAALEERKAELLARISAEQDSRTAQVRELVQSYRQRLESNSALVQNAISSMDEPGEANFLLVSATGAAAYSDLHWR
ncbi:hypothetical protein Z043_121394, partial [Scleropages formosus]